MNTNALDVQKTAEVAHNTAQPVEQPADDARDAEDLETALILLKRLKRDLMSARRFQADTLDTYRRACTSAETDIEEFFNERRAAMQASKGATDGAVEDRQ